MEGVSEYGDDDDGDCRVACQFCGRKFNMDRIGKHQAICQKVSNKRPPKPKLMHKPGPSRSAPPPRSNWRKQSAAFRSACRAGRGDEDVEPDDFEDAPETPTTPLQRS